MDTCRDELLFEVDWIQTLGLPGRLIVFSESAEAVIRGQNVEDIPIAVAELGKGRIIAFSHNAYGKQILDVSGNLENSIFYRNVRNWLMRTDDGDNAKFLTLDSANQSEVKNFKQYDILISLGAKESVSPDLVEEFIKHGGAMVHATTPWGWAQINSTKILHEMPYCQLLHKVGLCHSIDICKDHGGRFAPDLGDTEKANLKRFFNKNPSLKEIFENVSYLNKIAELPKEYIKKFKPLVEKYWKSAENEIKRLFPSEKIKTRKKDERNPLDLWQLIANLQETKHFKAPCIKVFPGDFEKVPPLSTLLVNYSSDKEDFFFPGCYAPAGMKVTLEVKAVKGFWRLYVGAHTDYLPGPEINRWPAMCNKTTLTSNGIYDVSSYFGGSLIFVSPKDNGSIEVKISNVVSSPRYDSQNEKSRKFWIECKTLPGLWADISGKYITITLPSSSVRNIADPLPIMNMYDQLLETYHDLRGTDINQFRKMWVVTDEQPVAGYMHAGYPIVTHMDVSIPDKESFLLNTEGFKTKAFWGIFHEIGHNMQQNEWTFDGTGEVTVNIFTLYAMQTLNNIPAWIHPWLQNHIQPGLKYVLNGADFKMWQKEPGTALLIYGQLVNACKWATYKRVFRRYHNLKPNEKPKNNQDKIDTWFFFFSQEAELNLAPLAAFWGIPLSEDILKKINNLNFVQFLPKDVITSGSSERISEIKKKFPNLRLTEVSK